MKKKYIVLLVVEILIVIISSGLGYIYAFVEGLEKVNDMQVRTHSDILLLNSLVLTRKLKSPDITTLVDVIEFNNDDLAIFVTYNKPLIKNQETLRQVDKALTAWEQAKKRLQELKALRSNDPSNPGTGN